MDYLIELGKISDAHGLKGELKIFPFNRDTSQLESLKSLIIDKKDYKILNIKYLNNHFVVLLENISSREEAESFKNKSFYTYRFQLPDLDQDTYYMFDIIGCQVYDKNGLIGFVEDIIETKNNDVYVINGHEGPYKKEILLPALKSVIKKIDIKNKKIDVEIPKGLLDNEYF